LAVFKRGKKGVYYCDFMQKGKRVYRSTKKFTETEAEAFEENLKRNPEILRTINLKDAIDRSYKEKWKDNKDGLRTYNRALHLVSYIGNVPIETIDEEVIDAMVTQMDEEGREVATVNRYLAFLRFVLNRAYRRWRLLDRVPAINQRRERNGRIRFLTPKEEDTLLEYLSSDPTLSEMHDLVIVLLDTGMRLSEVLNLSYDDVDFNTRMITSWINKGNKPRSIPMTRRVHEVMQRRCNLPEIFAMTLDQAQRMWKKVRVALGYKDDKQFVMHMLRHTCASRLVQAGVDLYTVKEILGHSTIRVTERYAHLCPEKLRDAIQILERGHSHSSQTIRS
jgi:integrase